MNSTLSSAIVYVMRVPFSGTFTRAIIRISFEGFQHGYLYDWICHRYLLNVKVAALVS